MAKLAKWLSGVVSTSLYGAFECMFLSCHVRVSELIYTLWLPECQGTPCLKQARNLKLSDCNWTRTHNHLVRKRIPTIWPNWLNDLAVLWELICTVHLTICSCHVTCAFQSESSLYSCLNVKELLAQSRLIFLSTLCYWHLHVTLFIQ